MLGWSSINVWRMAQEEDTDNVLACSSGVSRIHSPELVLKVACAEHSHANGHTYSECSAPSTHQPAR